MGLPGFIMGFLKKYYLFLIFLFSAKAQAENLEPLHVELQPVIERKTLWTSQDTDDMVKKANDILDQCRISVSLSPTPIVFWGTIPIDYDFLPTANKLYDLIQIPLLFLTTQVQYNGSAGLSPGDRFVFISSESRSPEYKKKHSAAYETLAHELGHMLGGLQHLLPADGETNLMSAYIEKQSAKLTPEQCQKMRQSPYLKILSPGV